MMKLPLNALVYSMEMFVKTIQGLQRIADRSIDTMLAGDADASAISPQAVGANASEVARSSSNVNDTTGTRADALEASAKSTSKERRIMDKDLHDDMLKLIRYKVLFVKREYEHAFNETEDLVSENMDGTAFAAWKTAEFIQELAKEETRLPTKWDDKSYPPGEKDPNDPKKEINRHVKQKNGYKYLVSLPDEDKKYVRVYFEVLERYPREKFKYEEQQIRVLEQIRDKIL